jgi:heterodisulfide reductase subunit B
MKTTAKNFDETTVAVAQVLGLELIEPKRWNCCGTVHALTTDDVMHYLAPIRNLIRVEEMKSEGTVDENLVVTQCAMCYNTLKRANLAVNEDPEKMEKIRGFMEKEPQYRGSVEVIQFLELLKKMGWDKIHEYVKKPLNGLKVVPYYGCLLLRPRGLGIDDPDNPQIFENLLKSLGANVVDIPYKMKCCGAYHSVHLREVTAELTHRILVQAQELGADIVSTACPLCEYNLGDRQNEIKKYYSSFVNIPVVYYTQLIALAYGLETDGFNQNKPDPRPLLRMKGLLED